MTTKNLTNGEYAKLLEEMWQAKLEYTDLLENKKVSDIRHTSWVRVFIFLIIDLSIWFLIGMVGMIADENGKEITAGLISLFIIIGFLGIIFKFLALCIEVLSTRSYLKSTYHLTRKEYTSKVFLKDFKKKVASEYNDKRQKLQDLISYFDHIPFLDFYLSCTLVNGDSRLYRVTEKDNALGKDYSSGEYYTDETEEFVVKNLIEFLNSSSDEKNLEKKAAVLLYYCIERKEESRRQLRASMARADARRAAEEAARRAEEEERRRWEKIGESIARGQDNYYRNK